MTDMADWAERELENQTYGYDLDPEDVKKLPIAEELFELPDLPF